MERNLRFKSDRASLIVGSKFTVFALFYFVSEGNWRGDLMEGFLRYWFGGGGGGFSEFYGNLVYLLLNFYINTHQSV